MAIHLQPETSHQQGHLKTIDESGIMLIFDVLQKYQYSFPFKSTARELLCNGIDSVSEKRVAREILTGRAKVEDYFVNLEGDLYKDSKFDPGYYDLEWLSDIDTVEMRYVVGSVMERDKVIFTDHGVGLGGKRLEGYFKMAYSSKRLSRLPLGKFGLGAKSPLSVGVDFYTVESHYNGRLFRFNVYSSKVDSLIPAIDMETGKDIPFVVFNQDTDHEYQVHYLETLEKNKVVVTIDAKKHHKMQYIDAVKSQMLYFDNINLVLEEGGKVTKLDYRADILYEDDLIVMSNNNYYSKPHLLLNKVNYGYVSWDELELEEKNGNIGIKVAPEEVDVNPSRESVLWTEKTKQKVLARFNEVIDIATGIIQKELQATDFLVWLKTCYSVYSRYSERGGIVGRLSKIVDLGKAKFKFIPDERIIFNSTVPMPGLFMRYVRVIDERESNKTTKRKVVREEFESMWNKLNLPVFLMNQGERASNLRDKWLYTQNREGFITVMEPYQTLDQAEKAGATAEEIKKMYTGKTIDRIVYWDALKASEGVVWYDQIEVPKDFIGTDTEVDMVMDPGASAEEIKKETERIEMVKLTAEERRKKSGKILLYTPQNCKWCKDYVPLDEHKNPIKDANGKHIRLLKPFDFARLEVPVSSINDWDAKEVYYGYEQDSELMMFIAMLTRDPAPGNVPSKSQRRHAVNEQVWIKMKWYRLHKADIDKYGISIPDAYQMQHFFDTEIMLVKVNKSTSRYYRDFSRIEEFFITIRNKTITMSNLLIKWNTARIIREKLAECAFLYNFPFNQGYYDMYKELCMYVDKHYREVEEFANNGKYFGINVDTYQDMLRHLDKVYQFQQFVQTVGDDPAGISALALELFGNNELQDGMAVDPEIMAMMKEILEFSHACGTILNYIPALTGYISNAPADRYTPGVGRTRLTSIPGELEREIRMYLDSKGMLEQKSSRQVTEELIEQGNITGAVEVLLNS